MGATAHLFTVYFALRVRLPICFVWLLQLVFLVASVVETLVVVGLLCSKVIERFAAVACGVLWAQLALVVSFPGWMSSQHTQHAVMTCICMPFMK
jgi:hypothetical protein